MSLEKIIERRITGIRPFDELPINAQIWYEAHNHHQLHRLVHAAGAHRPGIIYGLEVVASATRDRTVVVAPGIAIDPDGQMVLLADPVFLPINDPHQVFIALSFRRNVDRASAVSVGAGQEYFREVEGREVKQLREMPRTACLELARLFRSGEDKPIRDAVNPIIPGTDELNLLYRQVAFPYCAVDAGIGELSYVPLGNKGNWNPNRSGLLHLLREARSQGFHLTFQGPLNLRDDTTVNPPVMLYVAGQQAFQALNDADRDGLQRYLDGGGMLFAEASGGNEEFASALRDLAARLGAALKPVQTGHPLLTAHHVFAAPPAGAQATGGLELDGNVGILLSTLNYGGAWQGQINDPEGPNTRDRIRQALEFGANIIAYAARRRRRRLLAQLG
jgi:hypothetical protein